MFMRFVLIFFISWVLAAQNKTPVGKKNKTVELTLD
jgi:hypothetical protein